MPNGLNFAFDANSKMELWYEADGHRHMTVHMFFDKESNSNDTVEFILDTGAYITVLTQRSAKRFGYDKIIPEKKDVPLTGFGGAKCKGDLVKIPRILIGGKKIDDVRVVIPYVSVKHSILGANVLEHFNYLVDSRNDKIYFKQNPDYKAVAEFKCGEIWSLTT